MLELVIEAMVDAVVVIDAEGQITLANAGAEDLSGYSHDELRALRIAQLLGDEASGLRTVVRRRVEGGSILRREESWLFAKSGERVPVSVTASPILGADGSLVSPTDRARAVCQVHDNGPGIPAELLDKIWQPFFTTKGEAGTGFGLPVVREIVTSYGSQISIESNAGRGTTFTFDLPR